MKDRERMFSETEIFAMPCTKFSRRRYVVSARCGVLSFGTSTPPTTSEGRADSALGIIWIIRGQLQGKKGKSGGGRGTAEAAPDYERFPYVESVYEET